MKVYDIPVFYFPKFFHPDPSVKRQSGFLQPRFGESRVLGASVNIPYFHVISKSADLTFKPRLFSHNEFLMQTEYRKVTKNSEHIFDFSVNKNKNDDKNGRKTHFFSNSLINLDLNGFDESFVNLKIERTSNDGYIRQYSLENNENIKNTEVLESVIGFSGSKYDFNLDLSFESYETLGKINSDRYQFVYPNYSLNKSINLDTSIIDSLEMTSSGNQRIYNTNISEVVQINDFLFNSSLLINDKGVESNFLSLLKNVNSEGKNSPKFKNKMQSEVLSIFSYDLSLPLEKYEVNFKKFFTPKLSFRYSPNNTKNIKNDSRYLNQKNIFNLDRIGNSESIEGGKSITLGLEFEKQNLDGDKLLSFSSATVLRDKRNKNLPIQSTLGEKRSDIVGDLFYTPITGLDINYAYSLDGDLDAINLHSLKMEFNLNNFITTFEFYEENNIIGKNSHFTNSIKYMLDSENSLSFGTRKNKKNDLTEYYNLIYEYKNDCLTASLNYKKEYYISNDIKPFEQLFFNLTLIPLGGTGTDNLIPKK